MDAYGGEKDGEVLEPVRRLYRNSLLLLFFSFLFFFNSTRSGRKSELFSRRRSTSLGAKMMNHLNPAKDSSSAQPVRKTDIVKN